MRPLQSLTLALVVALVVPALSGCSVRSYALRGVADALSGPGGNYGTDDDPELVRAAAPFGLKTMEQLAESLPDHRAIRLAMASGFTQYSYAFVNEEADRAADKSMVQAQALWLRARRLYLRARDYALRGLDIAHPGTEKALRGGDQAAWKTALEQMKEDDVPYLYWAAASWGLAVSTAKDDANLIGDLPVIDAIMGRALQLKEDYDEGAIHEFYVALDSSRSEVQGGGPAKAKQHLDRALVLNKGKKLGALVSYAESVLVGQQKKAEFTQMLKGVVDADVYADDPAWKKNRLGNIVARERARWLLNKTKELFAD
jgi:predicted anti-sigma-YlaC factor YlaD